MGYNDSKNPLNFILPAGVLAYAASPQVRKAVRGALVKGVAEVMELVDRAESATAGLRDEFNNIKADADKMRKEQKEPSVRIEVEDHTESQEPPAAAEGAPA